MFSDDYYAKAMDFLNPKVNSWIKELVDNAESLMLSRPQKELIQALTIETLLYNSLMTNEEIIAVLSDIIRNIATRHAYGKYYLDWSKRAQLYGKS
jgi:predicted component of viral defense system (DUF524 family)